LIKNVVDSYEKKRGFYDGYEIRRTQMAGEMGKDETKQFQQEKYRQEIVRFGNVFLSFGREIARGALV
jgi:hypothetical protein